MTRRLPSSGSRIPRGEEGAREYGYRPWRRSGAGPLRTMGQNLGMRKSSSVSTLIERMKDEASHIRKRKRPVEEIRRLASYAHAQVLPLYACSAHDLLTSPLKNPFEPINCLY